MILVSMLHCILHKTQCCLILTIVDFMLQVGLLLLSDKGMRLPLFLRPYQWQPVDLCDSLSMIHNAPIIFVKDGIWCNMRAGEESFGKQCICDM